MKNNFEVGRGVGIPELRGDNFVESRVPVDVEVVGSPQQMHGKDQSHQAEVVIAMKVADEDMLDAVKVGVVFHELHLRTFSAVDEEVTILNLYQLA